MATCSANKPVQAKVCENCGKDYVPRSGAQEWCDTCRTNTCKQCGNTFLVSRYRKNAQYCSRACKVKGAIKGPEYCACCGKPFRRKYMGSKGHQRYCSKACAGAARRTQVTKACEWCGIEVRRSALYMAKRTHVFCSQRCANQFQARNKVACVCLFCGKDFRVSPCRGEVRRYCSVKCRQAHGEATGWANLIEIGRRQQQQTPNKLELAGYALMDEIGVPYQRQVMVNNKFTVDAFYPGVGLIVQFDGDYWHGHPDKYTEADLDERQRTRRAYDQSQDAYCKECGIPVVRAWECEVHKEPAIVQKRIARALANAGYVGEPLPLF